jgi:dihydrofolate reductase
MSVDGYVAGPGQDLQNPLGVGGQALHEWVFATRAGQQMLGLSVGGDHVDDSVDDEFFRRGEQGIGATVMGRNMFGPGRGPWLDHDWTGWWGDEPPYHHPVFVLTHHYRPSITMAGGTTFNFVDGGIHAALEQAFAAADGADVRIGGGASTAQQYLQAGLVDELHIAVVPVLLGGGARLFDDLDGAPYGLDHAELVASSAVSHIRFTR